MIKSKSLNLKTTKEKESLNLKTKIGVGRTVVRTRHETERINADLAKLCTIFDIMGRGGSIVDSAPFVLRFAG